MVGQALGVGALAALGAADWLNWMVLGMIQGISQGFAILMAYEFGAGDYRKLRQVIANSAILACLGSVVMLALMQAAARPVLLLLNTPDEIIGRSLLYLRIMFWGIPIVMAYNVLAPSFGPWETGKHRSTLWWWLRSQHRPGPAVCTRLSLGDRRCGRGHADRAGLLQFILFKEPVKGVDSFI